MDVRSSRAHVSQILNTVAAVSTKLDLTLVLPKYHRSLDIEGIQKSQGLLFMPKISFLWNFGIEKSGLAAFVLFNLPAALYILKKKISGNIDFVYFRTTFFLPTALFAWLLRIPFFYECHRRPMTSNERWRDHLMSKMCAGIITISSYMSEHYQRYKKRMIVAHDAVSLERFGAPLPREEARKKLGFADDEKICVYTGTISKLKGIETVVEAAKRAPDILFVLVGIIAPEFARRALPSNMKVVGKVEQGKLPDYMRAADALLLPHPRGEYSQSPMKLFEYMATGVPIVSSRLPSVCEVLNDKNAVLVEPESAEALVAGIRKVLNDSRLADTLAVQEKTDVQDYTWEKRGAVIASFIQSIV